jgi:endonuclease YncB( thermonuclease family)
MRYSFLMCAVIAVALVDPAHGASTTLSGRAEVHSGDSLTVSGTRVRLVGIDAPEEGQRCQVATGRSYDCGRISATALMDLTVATEVACRLTGDTLDGLPLANCTAGGYDLSKGMVHTGWALAWPRTGTIYAAVEVAARKRRHGLWRGTFEPPWDWRRKRRESRK